MSSAIDGLVSGLDTTSLVNSLMAVEASSQTALKTRVTTQQSAITSYQTVNNSMASLLTAAKVMSAPGALSVMNATSSSTDVAASVSGSAKAGSFDFTVKQVAKNEVKLSDPFASLTAQATTGSSVSVSIGGTAKADITPADGSLSALVDAINGRSDLGLRAAAITMGDGTFRLQVASASTGEANAFTLGGLTTPLTTTQTGQDAKIALAGAATAVISSATNTFTNVTPGLTFSLKPAAVLNQDVSISVSQDTDKVADNMSKMIDAANVAVSTISSQTSYNTTTKKGSPLSGDFTVRQLSQQIASAVGLSATSSTSAANMGVQLGRDGKLSFDRDKFVAALKTNPDGVGKLLGVTATSSNPAVAFTSATERTLPGTYRVDVTALAAGGTNATGTVRTGGTEAKTSVTGNQFSVTDLSSSAAGLTVTASATGSSDVRLTAGLAQRLSTIAQQATDSTTGSLTRAINGRRSTVDTLNTQISDWDVRLDLRRSSLQKTYSNLEVALGKLKNQSNWLSGQLASLG